MILIVDLSKAEDDWWYGCLLSNGRSGFLSRIYVDVEEVQTSE